MMFPGLVRPKGSKPEFTPLLRVGGVGGTLPFGEVVEQSFMGIRGINPIRRHFPSNMEYTLAARIQGKPAEDPKPATDEAKKEAPKPPAAEIKAILIGDLDLIGEQFFELRRRKIENLDFDNITFVLNCVDVLAGDEGVHPAPEASGRAPDRSTRLEEQTKTFILQSQKEARQAEDEAKETLEKAQKSLDAKVAKIREDKELDERTRDIKLSTLERVENRRLEVEKAAIEDDKRRKIQDSKATMEQSIRQIENRVRVGAILAAPLPALLLAAFIFGVRAGRENQGANPNRLA